MYNLAREVNDVFLLFTGLDAELYYVRQGIINTYAMNFTVPVAYNMDDLEFTWQSLAGQPVSLNNKNTA